MAYIVGIDRNQTRMVTTSLDALIDEDNSVRVIDAYVDSLDLIELGFKEYSGTNRGQAPYRRSDLLKLHIYGYLNKIRSSRSLEIECKRNLELMWLINAITPDHGTIAGFVKNNRKAFHVRITRPHQASVPFAYMPPEPLSGKHTCRKVQCLPGIPHQELCRTLHREAKPGRVSEKHR